MRTQIRRLVMLSLCLVMTAHGGACLPPPLGTPCGDRWCPAGQKCGPDVGLQQQVCVAEGVCGNGILDVGEECDCGNGFIMSPNESCASQPNSATGGWCSDHCKLHCGDGHFDDGEVCDTRVPVTADCVVRNHDFGRPGCSASCNAITVDSCGDWGWRLVDIGMSQTFNAIWGSQPHDIWASGNDMMLHYDGTAWHAENVHPFFDMWGSGPGDIFGLAVDGEPGHQSWAIWHYNGSRWRRAHASSDRLLAVWGSESADQSREVFVLTDKQVAEPPMTSAASLESDHFVILRCGMPSCEDTEDGTDWMEMTTQATKQPRVIWGTGGQDFFIAGDHGMIQRYHSLGVGQDVGWEDMSQSNIGDLTGIWGSASNNVYAIGLGGLLLHYDGQTWMQSPGLGSIINSSDLSSIWGSDFNDIFVVGSGDLVLHFDGSSWQQMQLNIRPPFPSHVWGTGPGDVYAISLGAAMVHYDGTDLQRVKYPDQDPPVDPPTLQSVWFSEKGGVYSLGKNAPGTDSSIVSYDGVSWKLLPLPSQGQCLNTQNIVGLWGCSTKDVCLIDDRGAMAVYGPSSLGCLALNWPATSSSVVAVWANGVQDMYAIGKNGVVMHSLTPFLFWNPMSSGTVSSLRAIWGSGPADIYAVGEGGTVIHYNGKGNAWQTVMPGSGETWSGVWGSGSNDVYVVAETSASGASTPIMHFDGKGWTRMESGTTRPIRAVWGSGPDDVYAVGDGGLLLHNDGRGWLPMRSIETVDFFGIAGDPAGRTRFIVGEQGTILRMTSPQ